MLEVWLSEQKGTSRKVLLVLSALMALAACAGLLHPSGSVTVGPQGGVVSGGVSGPGGSATVTVPVK
ncbi:MAG: hypothetical protein HY347_06070 [candidate division NC10 bacterium]|nr:hypothetical protein [candidate division NC10 bacterium]